MIKTIYKYLQPGRIGFLLIIYSISSVISIYLAYQLRFDFVVPKIFWDTFFKNLIWIIPLKLLLLYAFGQFGGLLGYFRLPDVARVFASMLFSSIILLIIWLFTKNSVVMPRGAILGDFIFSLILICGFRILLRVLREQYLEGNISKNVHIRRVAIIGAGDVGSTIASDFLARRGLGIQPVVFLDDDETKWKKHIHGITVYGNPDDLEVVKRKYEIDEVILAAPSASAKRIKDLIQMANALGLKADIVPSLAELTTGKVRANRVRPIEIEDLLGRKPVELDTDNISGLIKDKIVLVTGAGGSIGSELCRQIAHNNPKRLILVEQSEYQLFQIEQQLHEEGFGSVVLPLVGDITDEERMRYIIEKFSPEIFFHAAAHKHVHMLERQPGEAIKNNSVGSALIATLASEYNAECFVFISTDKAINPTNVMGASKRLAEMFIQAKHFDASNNTRFMAVRFGNVLGSSGSVVPIFKRQISQGGPVRVTHPEVSRYFMTIPEAVGLVLQCATQGEGGEIFVLDMEEPIKIVELARQMIELSGFRPDIDIEIEFIGLKPGEKLFEELQHVSEKMDNTQHSRIFRFISEPKTLDEINKYLDELKACYNTTSNERLKNLLKKFVPEYAPHLE